ncbi:MAG: PQQ-binding-like beta-propeller repeat protein [Planctomycetota bacterium]
MISRLSRTLAVASVFAAAAGTTLAQNADVVWPGFRGPSGDGRLHGLSHPDSWSLTSEEQRNVAWSVEIAGNSWSSPVVIGDTVYVVSAVTPDMERPDPFRGAGGWVAGRPSADAEFQMRAFDLATGDERWSKTLETEVPKQPTHPSNTWATETPVTDGERIYAHFGAIGLVVAVDLEGNVIWRTDLPAYKQGANFGTGASVALAGDRLIVHSDNQEDSFVVAFDTETGDEKWRQDRPEGSSWATPLVAEHEGVTQVIVPGPGHVTAYNATDGEMLWKGTGIGGGFSASPSIEDGVVIFGNSGPGRRGPLIGVNLSARGEFALDPKDERVAWVANSQGFTFASPVVLDGIIYAVRGSFFGAHDAETGKRIYQKRLPDQSEVVASLWTDGERIFAMNEVGLTFVVKAGREYELLGTNEIEGDLFSATPSAADDSLLIRGADKLYCVRAEGAG